MEQKIVDIQKIISDYKIIEKSNDKGELFHLIRYAMKEACQQAIELAAENADYEIDGQEHIEKVWVNKQSILDTINQIQ